jgi:hypothetical protein
MEMYFDTLSEKKMSKMDNIATTTDYFFGSGKSTVEWIMVKSGLEIQLLHLIFCSP